MAEAGAVPAEATVAVAPAFPVDFDENLAKRELKRFLFTGQEKPKYFPGCKSAHGYYETNKLVSIDKIYSRNKDDKSVLEIICKAHSTNMYHDFEPIAFALAKCLVKGSVTMREALYKEARRICATPEQIFMFSMYARKFNAGNGAGWRRFISRWYADKEQEWLAKECVRVKSYKGRSHQLLLTKSHIKLDETDIAARNVVIKYLIFGLKKVKPQYASAPNAARVLEIIQGVEDLRHCEDPTRAAEFIREKQYTLQHVPGHLLTAHQVWEAVLPQMPIRQLLNSIQRIHNMGHLSPYSSTVGILVSLLTVDNVKKGELHPIDVFITLQNYKNNTKPMKFIKAREELKKQLKRRVRQVFVDDQWQWTTKPKHPRDHKIWGMEQPPNAAVLLALESLLDSSWNLFPATDKRYMITLDVREHMFKGRHFCTKPPRQPRKPRVPRGVMIGTAEPVPGGIRAASPSAFVRAPKVFKVKKSRKNAGPVPPLGAVGPSDLAAGPSGLNAGPTGPVPLPPEPVPLPSGPVPPPSGEGDVPVRPKKHLHAECFYNTHVKPGDAAIILALHLAKREKNVTVAVFTDDGVELVDLGGKNNTLTFKQAHDKFMQAKSGKVRLEQPFKWALNKKKPIDVFINIVDRISRCSELPPELRGGRLGCGGFAPPPDPAKKVEDACPVRAFEDYKKKMKLPRSKFITLSLVSTSTNLTDGSHEGILEVVGLDEGVPRLLDSFAKGHFE